MDDRNEELNVEGPAGLKFAFKGTQLFPAILVLLLGAIFGYLFFQHDGKDDDRSKATIAALKTVGDTNVKAEATQRAMIYVLSLSQEERQKLNLLKPKELSDMQR